jgi:23S rRNA (uracil1939-C5)-methyltransferase
MRPGERLTLRVEKAVAGGRMLARHEGAIVLVAAAIPGETVEAEVEKVQRGTIWAVTRNVIEASADRVEPFCDWTCGGSDYAHVRYERQLDLKREVLRDAFVRVAHHPLEGDLRVAASTPDGYRMRARLHFKDGELGFFREGTHEVCDPASTRQLLPATIVAVTALERRLRAANRVTIREVAIAENCEASERACHLELDPDGDPSRLAALVDIPGVTGVSCGAGQHRRSLTLSGSPSVTDVVAGVRLRRHARAFFQGNRYLLADLVTRAIAAVPPGRVIDLYAGVGLFSAAIAARGDSEVIAVEGDPVAGDDLKHNIAPFAAVVEARQQSIEAFVAARRPPARGATILVDPPRTGMTKAAIAGVLSLEPSRLVYVSCDVATLARDAGTALQHGYRLASIEAFDMFPHTAYVESLAVFERASNWASLSAAASAKAEAARR